MDKINHLEIKINFLLEENKKTKEENKKTKDEMKSMKVSFENSIKELKIEIEKKNNNTIFQEYTIAQEIISKRNNEIKTLKLNINNYKNEIENYKAENLKLKDKLRKYDEINGVKVNGKNGTK